MTPKDGQRVIATQSGTENRIEGTFSPFFDSWVDVKTESGSTARINSENWRIEVIPDPLPQELGSVIEIPAGRYVRIHSGETDSWIKLEDYRRVPVNDWNVVGYSPRTVLRVGI